MSKRERERERERECVCVNPALQHTALRNMLLHIKKLHFKLKMSRKGRKSKTFPRLW